MKITRIVVAGLCLTGLNLSVKAQEQEAPEKNRPEFEEKGDPHQRPPREGPMDPQRHPIPREVIEQFDHDHDGKLNPTEMKEARDFMHEMHKKEILKRYDKNGDGKLSDSESEKMQKDRDEEMKKEILDEYDTNHNGKLDSAEKKKLLADAKLEPHRFHWVNQPGPHPLKELLK